MSQIYFNFMNIKNKHFNISQQISIKKRTSNHHMMIYVGGATRTWKTQVLKVVK